VGVFLFPALVGKLGLGAAQQALLAQNTVMLGTLMAMGSALFPTPRQRWIAAALFWGLFGHGCAGPSWRWGRCAAAYGRVERHPDFRHITQAFRCQHAMAGWMMLAYLLWRDGRAPV
jgi:hypothetical protein